MAGVNNQSKCHNYKANGIDNILLLLYVWLFHCSVSQYTHVLFLVHYYIINGINVHKYWLVI